MVMQCETRLRKRGISHVESLDSKIYKKSLGFKEKKKDKGYILTELLWYAMISALLIGAYMNFLAQSFSVYYSCMHSIDIWQNAYFTRDMATMRLRYSTMKPYIDYGGDGLSTGTESKFYFRYSNQQLYRKMSDGDLQPYTGIAVGKRGDGILVRRDGRSPIFSKEGESLYNFRWQIGDWEDKNRYPVFVKVIPYILYYE